MTVACTMEVSFQANEFEQAKSVVKSLAHLKWQEFDPDDECKIEVRLVHIHKETNFVESIYARYDLVAHNPSALAMVKLKHDIPKNLMLGSIKLTDGLGMTVYRSKSVNIVNMTVTVKMRN